MNKRTITVTLFKEEYYNFEYKIPEEMTDKEAIEYAKEKALNEHLEDYEPDSPFVEVIDTKIEF